MQLNQKKSSSRRPFTTLMQRGIFSITLFFIAPFFVSAATLPEFSEVTQLASQVKKSVSSFAVDVSENITHAVANVANSINASGSIVQEISSVVANSLTTTSRAFAHDAARTTNAIIATTKLPLDFITTSAGDYLNFTQGVGRTLTQNVTDASHASTNLYRGAFAFTTDTSKSLATTLANEVDTMRTVATSAGTILFKNTQNNIVTTANTAITSLGRTSHALVTLAAQTADHGVTTLNDTLTSATSFITTTADTIASRAQSTTLAFNPQHQTAALLPGATEILQSGYDAIYNFWGRFLNTVVPPPEVITPTTPEVPIVPTPPQLVSVPAPPQTPTTINRTVVTQPIIERTIERTRVLSGVTATDLASQIAALRAELLAELAKSQTTTQSKAVADNNALYLAMAPMNRINNLSSPTISSPTITNATISSGSLSGSFSGTVDGTSGSFTTLGVGTTSPSDTFAVNGVTYLATVSAPAVTNNRLYNVGGDLYWGASVIGGGGVGSWTLNGSDVTWTTGNVGIGTTSPYATLSVVGTSVLGTVTSGIWNGTAITDSYIDFGTASGQVSATDLPITDTGSYYTGITANTNAVLQHLGQGINERWSSGVVSGGAITTATGNTVNIASGVGYIGSTRITWNASTSVAMLQNGDNWISIDSTGAVRVHTTEPSIDDYIRLGYVYTTASNTVVGLAVSTPSYAGNYESRNNNFVMKGIGAVVQSGNIVGTTSTPLNIQATSGTINSNLKEFNVADASTFTKWYNSADNGWVTDTADNLVNTTKYNVITNNQASALATMTASYWKKDLILRTLDGNLHYIYGQTQYATEQDAKDAALPSIPTAITNGGSAYLATAVVQNGDTTLADRLYDIRPNLARVFGFGTSGTTGSIATHSALSGLGADDHTQYLLTSGSRAMAGSLNMGTNAITGAMAITMAGLLQNTLTTEQMRLRYDASNYTSFTVGSTGALTLGTTGTGTTTITNGVNVGTGNGYYVNGARAVSGGGSSPTSLGFSNVVSTTGLAVGNSNTSSSAASVAVGFSNTSSGVFSSAVGYSSIASGSVSSSFGYSNQATSSAAVAFGYANIAGGTGSVAIGNTSYARAANSIAIGAEIVNTTASSLMIGPSDAAKMTILSSGNVGIGTTSPYAKLSVMGETVSTYFTATSTTATSTILGKLAVGYNQASAQVNGTYFTGGLTSWMNNVGVDDVEIGLGRADNTTAAAGSMIFGGRSRGTLAAPTIVSNADTLLTLQAVGHDGTDFAKSSLISFQVDGTPGANDMPGRIVFSTSADGAQAPIERMRIKSTGNVGIGTTSPYAKLSVVGEVVASYFTATSTTATSTFTAGVNVGAVNGYFINGARAVSGANNSPTSFGFLNTVAGSGIAFGNSNTSSGVLTVAMGYSNVSSGAIGSVAIGYSNTASNVSALAFGIGNTASGSGSIAIGAGIINTTASSLMIGPSDAAKLTILSTGNVGIGTTSPYAKLSVVGEVVARNFTATTTTATSTILGKLAVGYNQASASVNGTYFTGGLTSWLNNVGIDDVEIGLGRADNTTAAAGSMIFGGRSRGTLAAPTAVTSGDTLLTLQAVGHDGTDFAKSSLISFEVDGTPGANDMPGRIVFSTSLDGAQTPTERMRITNAGNVGIGSTNPSAKLTFLGTVGQTTNFLTIASSSGSSLLNVDSSGKLSITRGTGLNGFTQGTGLNVTGTYSNGNAQGDPGTPLAQISGSISASPTVAESDFYTGIFGRGIYSGTANSTGGVMGAFNEARVTSGVSVTVDAIYGSYNFANATAGAATITNAYGSYNHVNSIFDPVTNAYGVYAQMSGAGATNAYGIYIDNQGSATNNFALYSANTTKSYFGGNVGIGTTSPYAKLSVVGETVSTYFTATSTTATSTFAGGFDVGSGAITYDYSAGLTSIQNLELGSLSFDTNAGVLSWIDMPVTASSTVGTIQSYSAQIDGNSLLTVYGESDGAGNIRNGAVGIGTTSPYSILSVSTASTTSVRPLFTVASSTGASLLTVTYDGKVGIGTAAPAKSLQVIGDIRVGTSGTNGCVENFAGTALTGTCSSDASLKTNIQSLGGVLPGLVQLTPSTFYWNDLAGNELHNSTTTQNYGLIAQDVARVLPSLVATTSNGYLGVNYSMLPILTLQGLKELNLNLEGLASTTAVMTDEIGEKTFAGRFFDRMTGWFADVANGIGEFFANRVHTKTLCVGDSVEGETCITKSQLDALLSGGSVSNSAPAPVEAVVSSTPITISINGNNPATLNIGDTYGDLGALITAPESAKNFGIKASLDGGPAVDISQISLDTSVAGSHTIVYSVTDQNDVTTTAERMVNVVAPVSVATEPDPTLVESPMPAVSEPESTPAIVEAPAEAPSVTPEPEPTPVVIEAPVEIPVPAPEPESVAVSE